jgi:hypothetical protein
MKKYAPYLAILIFGVALLLNACTRTQSTPEVPNEASQTPGVMTSLPDAIASQTAAPTPEGAIPTAEPPTATELPPVPSEPSTVAPTLVPPTSTPTEKPGAALTLVPKGQPTAGPSPTVTPQNAPFDPNLVYGDPDFSDPMNSSSHGNWVAGGVLPNTAYLQISLQNNEIYVTGKQPGFSTWFFSWPTLTDFYIQMTAQSGACSGKDEYGLIVRDPAHKAGVSYGYIVAFTCDGHYRVTRLDSADPYTAVDLVPLTKGGHINTGANQENVLGIRAEGPKLTIFANGYFLAEVSDNTYPQGRYGLFVQAVETYGYTYRPVEIAYWELND